MIPLFVWYWFVLKLGMLTVDGQVDFSKPLPYWKRLVFVETAQPVCRWLLFMLGFVHIKQSGPRGLTGPQGKANIYAVNHTSHFDIFIMMTFAYEGIPSFVAKRGVESAPFIGYKSKVWQGLYVDNRDGKQTGGNVAALIGERGAHLEMNPVCVFPEGTTTNGESVITFRTGAFIYGHPVKPVAIRYPPGNFSPTWETMSALWHMIRLFSQFTNACEIVWLPVYYPNEAEKKDPKLYAQNVRAAIAEALKVPMIDSTYNDKVEYHEAIGFTKPKPKVAAEDKPKKD